MIFLYPYISCYFTIRRIFLSVIVTKRVLLKNVFLSHIVTIWILIWDISLFYIITHVTNRMLICEVLSKIAYRGKFYNWVFFTFLFNFTNNHILRFYLFYDYFIIYFLLLACHFLFSSVRYAFFTTLTSYST